MHILEMKLPPSYPCHKLVYRWRILDTVCVGTPYGFVVLITLLNFI